MRCLIYARVSLEEQVQQFGLASQLRACREHAKQAGYEICGEFVDEGISGATLERPKMEAARALVRDRQADVLLAYDPDRISRDLADLLLVSKECDSRQVKLEFITMPAAESHIARMLFQIKGVVAEFERKQIRERTLRGRKEKAKQGFVVGGWIPYGYDYLGKSQGERGRYVINDAEAAVVRDIFRWADEGISIRAIAQRLNEKGIDASRGSHWAKSSVQKILSSERYCGLDHYYKSRRDGDTRRLRAPSEWIPFQVPAIIDRALWERVHAHLQENVKVLAGRPSRRYLLRGLVKCSCGKSMCGDPSHGSPVYRCSGRQFAEKCQRRVLAKRLDAVVWKAVSAPFLDRARMRKLIEKHFSALTGPDSQERIQRLQAQVQKLKAKETRGARALLDSDLEDQYALLKAEIADTRAKRRAAEDELSRLEAMRVDRGSAQAAVESRINGYRLAIPRFTDEDRREFLRHVIEVAVFDGTYVEIRCFFVAQYWPQRGHGQALSHRHLHAHRHCKRQNRAREGHDTREMNRYR